MNFKEEFEYLMEDVIRYIYGIPISEQVNISLESVKGKNDFVYANIPYLTNKRIEIYVAGLVEQMNGVSSCTTFFRVKKRFITNIVKNSISLDYENSGFFNKEEVSFIRTISQHIKNLEFKKNRLNSIRNYIKERSKDYGVSFSNTSIGKEIKICYTKLNILKCLAKTKSIKALGNEEYKNAIKIKLDRGIVTFSIYDEEVMIHDLINNESTCNVSTDNVYALYQNTKNYFEAVIPAEIKKDLISMSRGFSSWRKNQKLISGYESEEDHTNDIFVLTSTEDCSAFYINDLSFDDTNLKKMFIDREEKVKSSIQDLNKKIISVVDVYSNSLSKNILDLIIAIPELNINEYVNVLIGKSELFNDSEYFGIYSSLTENDIVPNINKLIEDKYIECTANSNGLFCSPEMQTTLHRIEKKNKYSIINTDTENVIYSPSIILSMNIFELKSFLEQNNHIYSEPIYDAVIETMDRSDFLGVLKNQYISFFENQKSDVYKNLASLKIALADN